MAVGPQYQSQLALLAGALGHGLDPTQGLTLYQNTLAAAQTAQQARQAEIQKTLGALAQTAQTAATGGATPDQIQALVRSAAAGLPRSDSQKVHEGIHGILGALQNFTAPVDPMSQAQLLHENLLNKQLMDEMTGGTTLDPSKELVYGPAHMQQVADTVHSYLQAAAAQGRAPDFELIRRSIIDQVGAQFPVTKADGTTGVDPNVASLINQTVSTTFAKYRPGQMGKGLPGYGDVNAAPAGPPAPPPSSGGAGGFLGDVGSWGDVWGATGAGGITGAAIGAAGGPFAPISVPAGAAVGSGIGFLGGLIHHYLS